MFILLIFAFISGLLTILAPCIWPILPIVLSSSAGGKRKPLGITLGILLSFTFFTLSISYLVKIFNFDPNNLRLLAVIVITFLGLTLLLPSLNSFLESLVSRFTSRFNLKLEKSGFWGGLITGISLGIVWSPCAGPILATIAALSVTRAVNSEVILVTLVYMIGTGIPLFIFSTLGSNVLTRSRLLSPYLGKIQQIFGVIMITTALTIYTNYDKVIQTRLLDIFPAYSNLLYKLEENNRVQERLNYLSGRDNSLDQSTLRSFLSDYGPAPDLVGITNWLNSDPLTLAHLRGKVVLIDFWTYSCINCLRTLPFITSWYEKYKSQGLVIVGVHTPEFEFEKNTENVQKALQMYKINYPVAQDNSYVTWNNYSNNYWPAKYLIDKDGHLRYFHFGEGDYQQTEKAIQSLLAETGQNISSETTNLSDETPKTRNTPETYLGANRMDSFASVERPMRGEQVYTFPSKVPQDSFALQGKWDITGEYSESISESSLSIQFTANKVFLVITPTGKDDVIYVNLNNNLIESKFAGKDVKDGKVILDGPRLYEIIDFHGQPGSHLLRLDFGTKGTKVFAFTFG